MKIHVLAQKTGLTPPTIRYYEQEGLLDTRHVTRGPNNYRDYTVEAVEHLQFIKRVQIVGFTLKEIRTIMEENSGNGLELELSQAAELLREKMKEMERRKQELEQVQSLLARMLANKLALLEEK